MMFIILLILLLGYSAFVALYDFFGFLSTGATVTYKSLKLLAEIGAMLVQPIIYIAVAPTNKCCVDEIGTAAFSPQHLLTILVIIVLCVVAYFYTSYRKKIAPPIIEVVVNIVLVLCVVLNIAIAIHANNPLVAAIGNLPIVAFSIVALIKNQQLFMTYIQEQSFVPTNMFEKFAWEILNLKSIIKYPVLLFLCLPFLMLVSALLLLFGQKPDSIIRAFTDTYKHGFSQLDFECDNVDCGGHYLCSVAANGHAGIVKPERIGYRHGKPIICNRQLLVSNAFEDLLQEHMPRFHKHIRKQYDKVGDVVHKYYGLFNHKGFSSFIYVVMKPLEWLFLLVLYCFDNNPENRIAKQYIHNSDRKRIDETMQKRF